MRVREYVRHVVILVQENRSFDNFFATYPGANGTRYGMMKSGSKKVRVALKAVDLDGVCDFGHGYGNYVADYEHGAMDGFNSTSGGKKCTGPAGTKPYQYVRPSQIRPYWDIADQYVLADELFPTQGSGSFTAHQDLIAGGTAIDTTHALVDFPSQMPWGCDAPAGTVTSLLLLAGDPPKYESGAGPFPCLKVSTLRLICSTQDRSPGNTTRPPEPHGTGHFGIADAIKAAPRRSAGLRNVTHQPTVILSDISGGTLPAVSWVVPDDVNSTIPETPQIPAPHGSRLSSMQSAKVSIGVRPPSSCGSTGAASTIT